MDEEFVRLLVNEDHSTRRPTPQFLEALGPSFDKTGKQCEYVWDTLVQLNADTFWRLGEETNRAMVRARLRESEQRLSMQNGFLEITRARNEHSLNGSAKSQMDEENAPSSVPNPLSRRHETDARNVSEALDQFQRVKEAHDKAQAALGDVLRESSFHLDLRQRLMRGDGVDEGHPYIYRSGSE